MINSLFLNSAIIGANNLFAVRPFVLASSFWCVATVWAIFTGFSHIWANAQIIIMRNMVSASFVLQLSESLVQAHPGHYHFVFDTFFNSFALLDMPNSMGHPSTGTVRKDCIDKASIVLLKKTEVFLII